MLFRLTLQNHMTYRPQEHEPGDFSLLPVGGEIAFACNFRYEDVIFTLDRIWCGERSPLSASEKALLEKGDALPERPGYTLEIPAGNYSLLQLPPAEDLPSLRRAAISAAGTRRRGRLYVRFLRESVLECVMQIFVDESQLPRQEE